MRRADRDHLNGLGGVVAENAEMHRTLAAALRTRGPHVPETVFLIGLYVGRMLAGAAPEQSVECPANPIKQSEGE